MESNMEVSQKLTELPYDSVIPLLDIYLKECAPGYDGATCIPLYCLYCSTIHNNQHLEQARCPITDEWIKKMYIYTMEFYSAIKKNKIMLFAGTWMELENFMLSKVSQAQKARCIS
jgi:hypothetical protein